MKEKTSSKTIAKNTMFLYFRMMLTMAISLYTSRVILKTLGVDDYGIYQAVGGIVGFMSFLNSALSTGSSRFLMFALGKGDQDELKNTFSTVLLVHIILAVIIIIVAESAGLWFFYHKMVIPEERMTAALAVFHLSILTAAVNITQVPYSGCIQAHEKFSLYAYVSIIESMLKLLIVYLLYIGSYDKLILYAILTFVVQTGLRVYYRYYCSSHFEECKFGWVFDKAIFTPIAKFSGWSLFSNISIVLNNQGVLLLLNMFFSPTVVAARALSLQVDGVVKQFVNNYKSASNPQIIKRYAAGDEEGSKQLMLQTSKMSFFLLLIIVTPVMILAEPFMSIWLGTVPEYTTIFLQLILIANLFGVFDSCFYQVFNASGRLKENALVSPTIGIIKFIIVYFLFKMDYSPLALSYAAIVMNFIISWIVKPYLIVHLFKYKWSDFFRMYLICLKVTIPTIIINYGLYLFLGNCEGVNLINALTIFFISVFSVLFFVWYLGLDTNMRHKMVLFLKAKLNI